MLLRRLRDNNIIKFRWLISKKFIEIIYICFIGDLVLNELVIILWNWCLISWEEFIESICIHFIGYFT